MKKILSTYTKKSFIPTFINAGYILNTLELFDTSFEYKLICKPSL